MIAPVPRRLVVLTWAGFVWLLLLGVVAAALRASHVGDLYGLLEPLRNTILEALGAAEPNPARHAAATARLDGKFAAHAMATRVHVGLGALFFVLVPLQFSTSIRARYLALHRWSGRLIIVLALISGLGGLYFGVLHPVAGPFERLIVGVVGTWFIVAIIVAYVSIRRGRTAAHREWMLRAIGAALGVSTVRLAAIPLDVVLTSYGATPEVVLLHSFWSGWVIMLLAAEWWIRRTRQRIATPVPHGIP